MASLDVHFYAAARAAAGVRREQLDADTVQHAVDLLAERHGSPLTQVLTGCSLLLDGVRVEDRTAVLGTAHQLDVLPPFAGGAA